MTSPQEPPPTASELVRIAEQLANVRKLEVLAYTSETGEVPVSDLVDGLDLPPTTAHQYCRELAAVGLLERTAGKPARYRPVEFSVQLDPASIQAALSAEPDTVDLFRDRYGPDVVETLLDVWPGVEAGQLTYRQASREIGMDHADFLRLAEELDLMS